VTLNAFVPLTKAALAGRTALASLEVIATVSLVLIKFQFASTELTVTLKAVPAVCALGVPVLPVAEPGAAVSPGASTCNLANAPALTVTAGLVLAVLLPSSRSEAVIVLVPAVLSVTLKFAVPTAKCAAAGNVAFASDDVMPTLSVTVLTRF